MLSTWEQAGLCKAKTTFPKLSEAGESTHRPVVNLLVSHGDSAGRGTSQPLLMGN